MERRSDKNTKKPGIPEAEQQPQSYGKPKQQGAAPKRRNNRDFRRMAQFNEERAEKGSWANQVDVEDKAKEAFSKMSKPRPQNRPKPEQQKAIVETPPKDELMYDGSYSGGKPRVSNKAQNFDCGTFSLICEKTYSAMLNIDGRLRRQLPFCLYQHYLAEILNAHLIKRSIVECADQRFASEADPLATIGASKLNVPAVFADYLTGFTEGITPSGGRVLFNLPAAGTPRPRLAGIEAQPSQGNIPARPALPVMPGGTFGVVNDESHNAYECYVSPFVTRRLIEETLRVNTAGGRNPGDWIPFPDGSFPNGAVCTKNLIGYNIPEILAPEAINMLQGLTFGEYGMAGRLAHSLEVMDRTSAALENLSAKFKMVTGVPEPKVNAAGFLILNTSDDVPIQNRLADTPATVYSAFQFGGSAANKAVFYGYHRERSNNARGLCMSMTNGHAPAGWNATCNFNHHMQSTYAPMYGSDHPLLRGNDYVEPSNDESRSIQLQRWIVKHFVVTRP